MRFALLSRPRTQAILDGKLKLEGLSVRWLTTTDPLGWGLPAHEKHRDIDSGEVDGGEMSISSFVQAKAQGAPILALPIFLKRGLAQRSIFCSVDSPLVSPEQLAGKKVGLVSYKSSTAVWMRGVFQDEYDLSPSSVRWFSLSSSPRMSQVLKIPEEFLGKSTQAWEELDGYAHNLDRRETFLLSLLESGELDAVVSFQAKIASHKIRPLLQSEDRFWLHYRQKGVYPINHLFVIRKEILNETASLAETLMSTFQVARSLWVDYLPAGDRDAIKSELEKLGWDPFACRFDAIEKRTLETFVDYLYGERMVTEKPTAGDMIHLVTARPML
jgi:4,5-dihydroxyphthalate decarboxylase